MRAPVDDPLSAVDQPFIVEIDKYRFDRVAAAFIQRKPLTAPVAGDVYKRQAVYRSSSGGELFRQHNGSAPPWDRFDAHLVHKRLHHRKSQTGALSGLAAVSYTHLDVYKRQISRIITEVSSEMT